MRVFTDGACSGNPGPGGWAWVTDDGRRGAGAEPETTNQRMELTAVLRAVETLDGQLDIHSDSTYVVNCFNDRWYEGWHARGWRNTQRKPVANRDLWEPLIEHYLARRHEITFTWVKGHAGDEMNELADRLAVAAIEELRAGAAPPVDDATPGPAPPWPAERAIVVTGQRDLDPDLAEALADAMVSLDPDNDVIVSGLRQGAELLGAELAVRSTIPLAVVLPYADPARAWSPAERRRFDDAIGAATWTVVLDGDPSRPGPAVAARNQWLWAAAVGAIVVGDRSLADAVEQAGLGVIEVVDDA
ncbi:MAG: ribonuclease H [Acidimicrobiales bacterium]